MLQCVHRKGEIWISKIAFYCHHSFFQYARTFCLLFWGWKISFDICSTIFLFLSFFFYRLGWIGKFLSNKIKKLIELMWKILAKMIQSANNIANSDREVKCHCSTHRIYRASHLHRTVVYIYLWIMVLALCCYQTCSLPPIIRIGS